MKKVRVVELNLLVNEVGGQLHDQIIHQFGQRAATQIAKQPVSQIAQDVLGQLPGSGSTNRVAA